MRLALGRDGKIGRQVVGQGAVAVVQTAPRGNYHGNVNVSVGEIEKNTKMLAIEKARERANREAQTRAIEAEAKRRQEIKIRGTKGVETIQRLAKVDPMKAKLKAHYARQMGRPQYEQVADSLYHSPLKPGANGGGGGGATSGRSLRPWPPADASGSGANMHIVAAEARDVTPTNLRADFSRGLIKGNPLTANGNFGPNVTDYDRFVHGTDVNDANMGREPIVGNTIVGRFEGNGQRGMGFDPFALDSYTNLLSDTADNVVDALPSQLAAEIKRALTGGGTSTTSPTGQITITRPVATAGTVAGVPKWALYTGLGLLGLGVLFVGVKAVRK